MSYFVYILRNHRNKLYIGQTKNLQERLKRHNSNNGARFVKINKNFETVYSEEFLSLKEAMQREKQLKGWTRVKKEALITGNLAQLKNL